MKSQTWKLSTDKQCYNSVENNNCRLQGFSLTSFGEANDLNNYRRAPSTSRTILEENFPSEQHAAIVCRNVKKWYNNRELILSGLNMRVPSGSVYALLGSSGCGKTTLLSCILGMSSLNEGSILVYGENVGKNNVGIPGRNVGFMPQQMSLYPEFTIRETFNYFASFGGLTTNQCVEKAEFFKLLLKLPPLDRKIGTLRFAPIYMYSESDQAKAERPGGGQQRRVSFAAALIHEPPLLILDEPTAGIDPIVRQTIWKFIEELSSTKKTTIIITTHYTEEARRANVIGVMRQGRILREQTPQQLIENYNSTSLEKAVLQLFKSGLALPDLCKDEISSESRNTCAHFETQLPSCPKPTHETRGYRMATVENNTKGQLQQRIARIKALTYKNFIVMIRNILLFSFIIWIPAAEMYSANVSFKFNPTNLKMGVINLETNSSLCKSIIPYKTKCSFENLSCQYLAAVDPDMIELVYFNAVEEAETAVHSGWLRGYLLFPPEFSQYAIATFGSSANDSVYNSTVVIGRFDETNKASIMSLKLSLYKALEEFLSTFLISCDLDPRIVKSPLQYSSPIYGKPNLDIREYTLPGVAIIVTYLFPIIVMGTRFIEERNCGMLERSFVHGVKSWEIFVAYLISEFWVLVAQAILVFIVATIVAGLDIVGSISLALLLLLLTGYCGSSFGILLGSVAREKLEVGILAIAIFLPNIFLSGICWPIQGMPEILQDIVNILPCTLPAESMRSIVTRGLEFSDHRVWPGFVALFVHMLFYSVLIMLIQRFKYSK